MSESKAIAAGLMLGALVFAASFNCIASEVGKSSEGHGPLGSAEVCNAASDIMVHGGDLAAPIFTDLDDKVVDRILGDYTGLESGRVAHLVVDGRPLAAVLIDNGGTIHETDVIILTDDLRTRLPIEKNEGRDAGSSLDGYLREGLVMVRGQPLVISRGSADVDKEILSVIKSDGSIVPTCERQREPLKEPEVAASVDNGVCLAMLAGKQMPAPMRSSAKGESLKFSVVPAEYESLPGPRANPEASRSLIYHDPEMASEVDYTLISTGDVDLDNSGKRRRVGLVSFFDGNSTAGDSSYLDTQIFPVYLDKSGVADLSNEMNRRLANLLPHGMQSGRLAIFNGATYLELSPHESGPTSQVWKVTASAAEKVCEFKIDHDVVRPISGSP